MTVSELMSGRKELNCIKVSCVFLLSLKIVIVCYEWGGYFLSQRYGEQKAQETKIEFMISMMFYLEQVRPMLNDIIFIHESKIIS